MILFLWLPDFYLRNFSLLQDHKYMLNILVFYIEIFIQIRPNWVLCMAWDNDLVF